MTVASLISRGIGPGGTIETVILRGLEVGAAVAISLGVTTYQIPAERHLGQEQANVEFSHSIRQLFEGKQNNVLNVTVDTDAGTTIVTDARIGVDTVALCIPVNAAARAVAAPYRHMTASVNGSMMLVHVNDANLKTYKVVLIG